MRPIFILFLFSFYAHFSKGDEQNYFFEQISPESGFAFDAIYSITEDCNGFIWFGCNNGLYYYNTSEIKKIKLETPRISTPGSFIVSKVYRDLHCQLWVCSEYGLFHYQNRMNQFAYVDLLFSDFTSARNFPVTDIIQFNNNTYLIVSEGRLYSFSHQENILKRIPLEGANEKNTIVFLDLDVKGNLLAGTFEGKVFWGRDLISGLKLLCHYENLPVKSVCLDDNKYFIGYEGEGIDVVNMNGTKILEFGSELKGYYRILSNRVRQIIKRANGEIWIGTYRGINILSNGQNIEITNKQENGLPNNSIYELHQGVNDGIWIGTWAGGIVYYSDYNFSFRHIQKVPNEKEHKSIISSFASGENGEIFIGSEQAGINSFDINQYQFNHRNDLFNTKDIQGIKSLTTGHSDQILIGTFDKGLWLYDRKMNRLKNIESNQLSNTAIISTSVFLNNEFWLGTRSNGLFKFNPEKEMVEKIDFGWILDKSPKAERIWKLFPDSAQNLWIGTDEGLFCLMAGSNWLNVCLENDTLYDLNKSMIFSVCEDKNKQLWIGTRGKGLYVYYPENDSIGRNIVRNLDVYSIVMDHNQDMWFSTNNGIYQYQWENNTIVRFTAIDGLSGEQYNPNAAFICSSGNLLFGSPNGFNIINPDIIQKNTIEPQIFLSKILINNRSIRNLDNVQSNSLNVAEINQLELKYKQNSIHFGVVSNNFIKPEKNRFRYRLINYNDDWIETGHNQDIVYTKIPPGKYTLEVHGSNNDGIWSKVPYRLDLTILPPLWLRWYSKLTYLLILIGIAYIVLKELSLRMRLRKEIMAERYKSEAREMLYSEKLKFFTNISHELRTPLTLIISPLNNLIKKFQFDEGTIKHLNIIQRNSKRLLQLTNQILDLRLIESGKLTPNFQKTDLISLSSDTYKCFEIQIAEKQINFIFTSAFKSVWVNVDAGMIEKIIYNLISNAIKFSPEKGQIILSIEKKYLSETDYPGYFSSGTPSAGEVIELKIRDFGKGIKEDLLPKIFDRFVKDSDENNTGTGIGLNLCQEYARLNHGNILVSSQPGKGSTFIFHIPINNKEYEEDTIIVQFPAESSERDPSELNMHHFNHTQKVVLLAEDNDELRTYLKDYLSNYFKVITAKNGKQAAEIAQEIQPDILITDILMPEKDGIEVIQILKNNYKTSHIPIIVLTALYEGDYQIKSIIKGADAYLVKPVNESLLLAQIENILTTRDMIKKRTERGSASPAEADLSGSDSIIEKIEKTIEKNLHNSEFDTLQLAHELNVSRSTLHRKIKSATNQNPTEFIRDIRLKHAISLLKTGKYNIDEIAAFVGFNSTSYFIRSFKNKYGITPAKFKPEKHDR